MTGPKGPRALDNTTGNASNTGNMDPSDDELKDAECDTDLEWEREQLKKSNEEEEDDTDSDPSDDGLEGVEDHKDLDSGDDELKDAECETDSEWEGDQLNNSDEEEDDQGLELPYPEGNSRRRARETSTPRSQAGSDCSSTARRPEAKRSRTTLDKGKGRAQSTEGEDAVLDAQQGEHRTLAEDYYLDQYNHVEYADKGEKPTFPTVRIDIEGAQHVIHGTTDRIIYTFRCVNSNCGWIHETPDPNFMKDRLASSHNDYRNKVPEEQQCKNENPWTQPEEASPSQDPQEDDYFLDLKKSLRPEEHPWICNPKRKGIKLVGSHTQPVRTPADVDMICVRCPFDRLYSPPQNSKGRSRKRPGMDAGDRSGRTWKRNMSTHLRHYHKKGSEPEERQISDKEIEALFPTKLPTKVQPNDHDKAEPWERAIRCPYGQPSRVAESSVQRDGETQPPDYKECNHWFVGEERNLLRLYHLEFYHNWFDPSAPHQDPKYKPGPAIAALNGNGLWEESGTLDSEKSSIVNRKFWERNNVKEKKEAKPLPNLVGEAWKAPKDS